MNFLDQYYHTLVKSVFSSLYGIRIYFVREKEGYSIVFRKVIDIIQKVFRVIKRLSVS